jgi:NAD(P)-dependent dehydrogenase (short-subunit alcohol dehydrogenase family)
MSGRFAGKCAIVTGGSSGIGRATVELLEREGARVAAIAADGPIRADLRDAAQATGAVARAIDELGGADILVNSAGIYRIAPFLELDVEEWDDVLTTNLRGSFLAGQAVARAMVAAGGGGAIVNIASIAAIRADLAEPCAHYCASKAGVLALTRQMAAELAVHGIRVNAVLPGVIHTPMLRLLDDPAAAAAYLEHSVPLGRLGQAEEVAAVIGFLASSEASYITGAALGVDGGAAVY